MIIEILPGGSKTWRYKYHLAGKREKVTIGAYAAFFIKDARDRHEELRQLVERGESPAKVKQKQAVAKKQDEARALSFSTFAQRWVDETLFYRSATYRAQIIRRLDVHVYPEIGDVDLAAVTPAQVLAIIEKMLDTPTSADRVRVTSSSCCWPTPRTTRRSRLTATWS